MVVVDLVLDVIVEPPAARTSLIPKVASLRLASRKEAEVRPDMKEEEDGEVEKERRVGWGGFVVRDRDRDLRFVDGAAEGEVGDTLGVRATMEIPVSHAQPKPKAKPERYEGMMGVEGSKDLFRWFLLAMALFVVVRAKREQQQQIEEDCHMPYVMTTTVPW